MYLVSCSRTGAEILEMSNLGDYPMDDYEDPDYEIIAEDYYLTITKKACPKWASLFLWNSFKSPIPLCFFPPKVQSLDNDLCRHTP